MNLVLIPTTVYGPQSTNDVGFNIGVRGQNQYVICNAKDRTVYEAEAGRSEWVTVVEYICVDGTAISLTIIFKGETFSKAWVPTGMDKQWNWASTSKGWTCDDIAFQWITRVFDVATCGKANGRRRALVYDGHGSHVQPDSFNFALITIFLYY